jgi:hypothetical protein
MRRHILAALAIPLALAAIPSRAETEPPEPTPDKSGYLPESHARG